MTDLIQLSEIVNEKHRAFETAMEADNSLDDPRLLAAIELIGATLKMLECYQDECEQQADQADAVIKTLMAASDDSGYFRA